MIPCRGGTGFISPPDSTNLVLHFSIKHTILIHFGSSWLIFWHPCFWTTYLSHWQTHIFWHACGHIGKGSFGLPHYCTRGTGTGTVTGPGPSGAKRGQAGAKCPGAPSSQWHGLTEAPWLQMSPPPNRLRLRSQVQSWRSRSEPGSPEGSEDLYWLYDALCIYRICCRWLSYLSNLYWG